METETVDKAKAWDVIVRIRKNEREKIIRKLRLGGFRAAAKFIQDAAPSHPIQEDRE